jgi:hypothetical protein
MEDQTLETRSNEAQTPLVLNWQQQGQWHAHLMTYFLCLAQDRTLSRQQAHLEMLQGVGIKLFGAWKQGQAEVTLWLSEQERHALHEMFATLQVIYERYAHLESSQMALQHVADSRALLEQSEQKEGKADGGER